MALTPNEQREAIARRKQRDRDRADFLKRRTGPTFDRRAPDQADYVGKTLTPAEATSLYAGAETRESQRQWLTRNRITVTEDLL